MMQSRMLQRSTSTIQDEHNTPEHSSKFTTFFSRLRRSTEAPLESKQYAFYWKKLKHKTSLDDIADLMNEMLDEKPPLFPNNLIINTLIQKVGEVKRMDYVYTLYDIAKRKGIVDAYTYSNILNAISKNHSPDYQEAKKWLSIAKSEALVDSVTYNNTLNVVSKNYPIDLDEAMRLFDEAIATQHVDEYTFSIIIAMIAKMPKPKVTLAFQLLEKAKEYNLAAACVYTSTINVILKRKNPDLDKAYQLFDECMATNGKKNAAFYSCIMPVIAQHPDAIEKVNALYQKAKNEACLDTKLYQIILDIHLNAEHPDINTVIAILREAKDANCNVSISRNVLSVISERPELNAENILFLLKSTHHFNNYKVDFYCELIQLIAKNHPNAFPIALKLLEDSKKEIIDIRIFNAVLEILLKETHNSIAEGLKIVEETHALKIANAFTYTVFITIISRSKNPNQHLALFWLREAINNKKATISTYTNTFAIMSRCKSPDIAAIKNLLENAGPDIAHNIDLYNNAIYVLAHSRVPEEKTAYKILEWTQSEEIADRVTYTNTILVLSKSESSTKVQDACQLLQKAKDNNIEIDIGIYNCLLDLIAKTDPNNMQLGVELLKEGVLEDFDIPQEGDYIDLHELSYGSTYFFLKHALSTLHQQSKDIHFVLIYGKGLHSKNSDRAPPVKQAVLTIMSELENNENVLLEQNQNPQNAGQIEVTLRYKKNQKNTTVENTIHPFIVQTIDSTMSGAIHGLIHGTANAVSEILEPYGVEKDKARSALYYGGIFSAKVSMLTSEIADPETCLQALYQSALETGQIWLVNTTLSYVSKLLFSQQSVVNQNRLSNHSWLTLGLFTKNILEKDSSSVTKSFIDEALTKAVVETSGKAFQRCLKR